MNERMRAAQNKLSKLLAKSELTAGMYVRVHGDHLIVGRQEQLASQGPSENLDRVRFTRLSERSFGLSVKRHTGRWERTPFSGEMKDMVNTVLTYMQHLVAPY